MTFPHRTLTARVALLSACVALAPVAAAQDRESARNHAAAVERGLDDWNVPAARAALDRLKAVAPGDNEGVHQLEGRVLFEEGRYDEALEALGRGGAPDRPGTYLRLVKDTAQVVAKHASQESANFIFSYPEGKDAVLAPYALEALESMRSAMLEDLGWAPEGKVRVEVVNNARELARVSTLTFEQIRTTGTIAICKFNKLIITSPKAVVRGYDWLDTLAHEYVHLVVSQASGNTVPIWLHEGMAKYLETRWRGPAGGAMSPSTLALLGRRVKADTLIPFEKMHPSIALLPTAEDAATAFAEVFFAIDWVHRKKGAAGLRTILSELSRGQSDRKAVEAATGTSFRSFERAWLAHVRAQPFPPDLGITDQEVKLKEGAKDAPPERKGRQISFGAFKDVREPKARKHAHLGELLRERRRMGAAAEQYGRAYREVGDRYEALSNKYALTLLELSRTSEARQVLEKSLLVHPGISATHVHLGRIHLHEGAWDQARGAYLQALAVDPFDPEIHLALLRANTQLKQPKLATRARAAVMLLTGLTAEEVDAAASRFGQGAKELSDYDLPAPATPQADGEAGAKEPAAKEPGTKAPDAASGPKDRPSDAAKPGR